MSYSEIFNWGSEVKNIGMDGMSNAAIETFRSADILSGFIRELIQNSQDARRDNLQPLRITIRLFEVNKKELPAFESGWNPIYESVKTIWKSDYKGFFENADNILSMEKMNVLEFSDYNSSGLSGTDIGKGSFNACVRSEGNSSQKGSDAGGSYGIGKNSVFGLSGLRTVLYSSMNIDEEHIFQGISKLAQYRLDEKGYSSRIFLGKGSEFSSIRIKDEIPRMFQRAEPGLSQFVCGVNMEPEWYNTIQLLIIQNYFLLLDSGMLKVTLIDESGEERTEIKLDKLNYREVIQKDFNKTNDEKSKHIWHKIQALQYPPVKKENFLDINGNILKDAFILYLNNESSGANEISYFRRGMKIYTEKLHHAGGIGYLNLSGVFYSESKSVNECLRAMEPAAHDSWNPDLLDIRIRNSEELLWAKNLKGEIKRFIRDEAKKLLGTISNDLKSISEVDDLLNGKTNPSSAFISGSSKRKGRGSEEETALKTGKAYEVTLNLTGTGENSVEGEFLDKPKREPKGKTLRAIREGRERGPGKAKLKSPAISYNTILISEGMEEKEYELILKSDSNGNASLAISQAADRDGKITPEVLSVLQNDKELSFSEGKNQIDLKNVLFENNKAILNIRIKGVSRAGFLIKPLN